MWCVEGFFLIKYFTEMQLSNVVNKWLFCWKIIGKYWSQEVRQCSDCKSSISKCHTGPWCTVSIHAFSAITPLVLNVKTCTMVALSAQPVLVHSAEPQMPDGKVGERTWWFPKGLPPTTRIWKPVPASFLQYTDSLCGEKPSICLDCHVLHGRKGFLG